MQYQQLKKLDLAALNERMANLGFLTENSKKPIYWKHPHKDKRLAWIVHFASKGNTRPEFCVRLAAYWVPDTPDDESFPNCVGYMRSLSETLNTKGYEETIWSLPPKKDPTPEQVQRCFDEPLKMLQAHGFEWFEKFSTPKKYLTAQLQERLHFGIPKHPEFKPTFPLARTAADLGLLEQARTLYRDKYKSSLYDILLELNVNDATPFERLKQWQKDRHQRIINEYSEVCKRLGLDELLIKRELASAERELLVHELEANKRGSESEPRSQSSKAAIKYCETRISELDQVLETDEQQKER